MSATSARDTDDSAADSPALVGSLKPDRTASSLISNDRARRKVEWLTQHSSTIGIATQEQPEEQPSGCMRTQPSGCMRTAQDFSTLGPSRMAPCHFQPDNPTAQQNLQLQQSQTPQPQFLSQQLQPGQPHVQPACQQPQKPSEQYPPQITHTAALSHPSPPLDAAVPPQRYQEVLLEQQQQQPRQQYEPEPHPRQLLQTTMDSGSRGSAQTDAATQAITPSQNVVNVVATAVSSDENEKGAVLRLMARTPVASLRPRLQASDIPIWQGAVVVPLHACLPDAFLTLARAGVLSAPVVSDGCCVGLLDTLDLVRTVAQLLLPPGSSASGPVEDLAKDLTADDFRRQQHIFATATVRDLAAVSSLGMFVRHDFSLLYTVETLARLAPMVHALPVVSQLGNGQVLGLVTQSMVVAHWNSLPLDELCPSIARLLLHPTSQPVFRVYEHSSALQAFVSMAEQHVSGLAVVDAAGRLVDVISSRDLRRILLGDSAFLTLFESVARFKATLRLALGTRHAQPVTISSGATLKEIVRTLHEAQVHRVFVVDDGGRPLRVVSQTDVITAVMRHLYS